MKVRRINLEKDYPTLASWWTRRGSESPPEAILPETGVVCEDEKGLPAACAWMYLDRGGRIGVVEWEATNPDITAFASLRALHRVFDFFEDFARKEKLVSLVSWVKLSRGDGRLLQGRGWMMAGEQPHVMMAFGLGKVST